MPNAAVGVTSQISIYLVLLQATGSAHITVDCLCRPGLMFIAVDCSA